MQTGGRLPVNVGGNAVDGFDPLNPSFGDTCPDD